MNPNPSKFNLGLQLSATGEPVEITAGTYLLGLDGDANDAAIGLQMHLTGDTWATVQDHGKVIQFSRIPQAVSPIQLPAGEFRCFVAGGSNPRINATLFKIA